MATTNSSRTGIPASASGSITASAFTMTTARLLGRTTAGTGAIEEITVGAGLTLSGGTLTGAGGTPGGSDTQVQYNAAGAFAGVAGWIFDGVSKTTLGVAGTSVGAVAFNNATSGSITLQPAAGALGAKTLTMPALTDTLAVIGTNNSFTAGQTIIEAVGSSALTLTGATQTVSHPVLSATQTWNAAVTFTGKQTAITATSANIDSVIEKWLGGAAGTTLQMAITGLGGTASNGPAVVLAAGTLNSPALSFGSSNVGLFGASGLYKGSNLELIFGGASTAGIGFASGSGFSLNSTNGLRWSGTASADTSTWDTALTRGAAGVVQFNGGAAATTKGGYQVIDDTTGSSHTSTSSTELTTLNTGATTTATSGNLAAANSKIKAILLRVNTTITTAANFTVKVTGGNAFAQIGTATTSNSTLASGTNYVLVPAAHADAYVSAATTLTYTTNANPGAGAIRATVIYETFTPPSS